MEKIITRLFEMQDTEYKNFLSRSVPGINADSIIGVRTPALRKYAKELSKDRETALEFISELPHTYYEENNLHGALLSLIYKDVPALLEKVEEFLPYVDNWATCDMMSPKAFKKDLQLVYEHIKVWLKSRHIYTVRFGIVTLLGFYLTDEVFEPGMLELVCEVSSDEYYVKMAVAWYFSMALVKQYDSSISYITEHRLPVWTHNKAIQKAIESRQIHDDKKQYLKSLKI